MFLVRLRELFQVTFYFGGHQENESTNPFAAQVGKLSLEGGPKARPIRRSKLANLFYFRFLIARLFLRIFRLIGNKSHLSKPLKSEVSAPSVEPGFMSPATPVDTRPEEPSPVWNDILQWLSKNHVGPAEIEKIEKRIKQPKIPDRGIETRDFIAKLMFGDKVITSPYLSFQTKFAEFCSKNSHWEFDENVTGQQVLFFRNSDYVNKWPREGHTKVVAGKGYGKQVGKAKAEEDNFGDWMNEEGFLVIRRQTWKNCFLNAPVTLLHYLLLITTQGQERAMVNVSRYLAKEYASRNGTNLATFILNFGGSGGDSIGFLEEQLLRSDQERKSNFFPTETTFTYSFQELDEKKLDRIMDELELYPALVSHFKMTREFYALNSVVNYYTVPTFADWQVENNDTVSHAMVCLGKHWPSTLLIVVIILLSLHIDLVIKVVVKRHRNTIFFARIRWKENISWRYQMRSCVFVELNLRLLED
jgi:hypothetical protein